MSTETTNQTVEAQIEAAVAAGKKPVTIHGVLQMLKEGKDREAIRTEFNLTKAELKDLFSNPKLKGAKVHTGKNANKTGGGRQKKRSFVLIDDAPDVEIKVRKVKATTEAPTATTEPAPTPEASIAAEATPVQETAPTASNSIGEEIDTF